MNDYKFKVVITRKRIKNMYLRIKGDTVCVSAPLLMPGFKIDEFIRSRQNWIMKRIFDPSGSSLRSDDEISFRGRKIPFKVMNGRSRVIESEDGITVFCKDANPELALKLFYRYGSAYLYKDIEELLPKFLPIIRKLGYQGAVNYEVRMQKSLWGICYPKRGLIRLSSRLIHFNKYQVEAVLWHELLHFIVPDHSPRFHRLAATYMKDYESIIRSLK